MATIESRSVILELLQNNGRYFSDPQCDSIWSYTNQAGNKTHAVFYDSWHDMYESPYAMEPVLLKELDSLNQANNS
jgi:hypothetical protein